MLIHRVLVVLVELHQATDRREHGENFLKQMRPVHGLERPGCVGS